MLSKARTTLELVPTLYFHPSTDQAIQIPGVLALLTQIPRFLSFHKQGGKELVNAALFDAAFLPQTFIVLIFILGFGVFLAISINPFGQELFANAGQIFFCNCKLAITELSVSDTGVGPGILGKASDSLTVMDESDVGDAWNSGKKEGAWP